MGLKWDQEKSQNKMEQNKHVNNLGNCERARVKRPRPWAQQHSRNSKFQQLSENCNQRAHQLMYRLLYPWHLCLFSICCITNSQHTDGLRKYPLISSQFCRGLKQHRCLVLRSPRAEVQNESSEANLKVFSGLCSGCGLRGKIQFLAFSGLERPPAFLGLWPLLSSSGRISPSSASAITTPFFLWLFPLSFLLKDPVWLHWAHLDTPRNYPYIKILNVSHL